MERTMLRRSIFGALIAIASVVAVAAAAPVHDSTAIVTVHPSSAAVERFALRPPVQLPAVRAAIPSVPSSPSHRHRLTDSLGLLAVAGATKKRTTRRTSGKKRDVPMYLDSDVHVMRENDDGKLATTVIKGGVLVDDTDLSDDEIDELTARRVIRPATVEEIDALDAAGTAADRAELVKSQEEEMAQLRANQEQARATLAAKDNVSADALAKADQKAAMDVASLQEKHATALAKFDAK
jgi:hypothetical protein